MCKRGGDGDHLIEEWLSIGAQRDPVGDSVVASANRLGSLGSGGSVDGERLGSPGAAAEWARTQTIWEYGSELDLSDGVSATIVLGSEYNANQAAWEAWDGEGELPDAPGVRNFAEDLGLLDRRKRR